MILMVCRQILICNDDKLDMIGKNANITSCAMLNTYLSAFGQSWYTYTDANSSGIVQALTGLIYRRYGLLDSTVP